MFGLIALSLASFAAAQTDVVSKLIVTNTGNEDLALYFLGRMKGGDVSMWDGSETFAGLMAPGDSLGRFITFDDTFSLRSGDMKWRMRLSVYAHDQEEHPYKMSFHNVMVEEGAEPIELKHHEEGHIWIDPSEHVTHSATAGHPFVIRDTKSKGRFTVEVHPAMNDEL